jgi:uncharacterized damage-inducible protein DinB
MPGMPGPVADELDGLKAFLTQQRYVLRLTAHGLTDEQARLSPTVSSFSVGGLIKHVAQTERGWIDMLAGRTRPAESGDGADDYLAGFRLAENESLADALSFYDEVAVETDVVLAGLTDLDQPVPVPQDVPWFPRDVTAWSARWVLLHVIEETARHAGHADIVRESVDGGTAFPLMAAAEGWPSTPWMKPWSPPDQPVATV